jgi:hypothetical protein
MMFHVNLEILTLYLLPSTTSVYHYNWKVLSCLSVRLPSFEEIKTCEWIKLTSPEECDPKLCFLDNRERVHQEFDLQSLPVYPKDRTMPSKYTFIKADNGTPELFLSICSAQSSSRKPSIDVVTLAKQWSIGLDTATRTLNATTQLALRQAIHPIQRCYHTEVMQLRNIRLGGRHGRFYTDTPLLELHSLEVALWPTIIPMTLILPRLITPWRRKLMWFLGAVHVRYRYLSYLTYIMMMQRSWPRVGWGGDHP